MRRCTPVLWALAALMLLSLLPGCGKKKDRQNKPTTVNLVSIVGVRGEEYNIVVSDPENTPAGEVQVRGDSDIINVGEKLEMEMPNLRSCFLTEKRENHALSGMVHVKFRIKTDGRVVNLEVTGKDWNNHEQGMKVEMCITRILAKWNFPLGKKDVENDFVLHFQ